MLDGIYLYFLADELRRLVGYRVDRIHQPLREELVLALRGPGESCRLLISAHAAAPRILLAQETPDNPAEPPMFCMLMRKHLGNAKLTAIRQQGLDRILYLDFLARNEFGDEITLTLAVEIMGRHSNVLLVGPDGRIIDAMKRIGEETSSVHPVLPGMTYTLPPAQAKLRLTEVDADAVLARMEPVDRALSSVLFDLVEGMGPLTAREAAYRATGEDPAVSSMDGLQRERLRDFLTALTRRVRQHEADPVLLCQPDGTPKEFCYMEIAQYGTALEQQRCDSLSQAVELFYRRKASAERMKQRAGELVRQLHVIRDRIERRLQNQKEELARCADREALRIKADLLNANLYRLEKGMGSVTLENFYDEGRPLTIELDRRLTPQRNAQRYYTEYRKAATAERMLEERIRQGEQEAAYIESVADSLSRAATIREVAEIRRELGEQGYLRRGPQPKGKAPAQPAPDVYASPDGIPIRVGKNNLQNDRLTFKQARGEDIWLHAKDIPGSHVVISTEGIDAVPDATLEAAAMLAAYNSKAEVGRLVPVDYTRIKYVKKQPGGKPGQVFYKQFKTVFVTPTEAALEKAVKRIR